ncbi:uncharacterized protein LOC135212929 [Macrobrachium nipponense]|uniref:uncharacterized protein LOC135212929 n=1 Tax=Macrobrachium nipponense TaxID=159736 RepID=UPI0030C7E76C
MARLQVLLAFALLATTWAAPQFGVDDQPPTPYEFEYGVNVQETGDVKEHKESVSPTGRTEGEYRWLQPNGLFMVVRYYVDGDSGFVAEVSEEPGSSVEARYRNSLSQEAADTVSIASSSSAQSFAKSIDVVPTANLGAAVNVISAPQPSRNRQSTFRPRPVQTIQTVRPIQTFQPVQQQQQNFVSSSGDFNQQQQQQQSFTSGGFIDGGIIDGGIIDGGIIDGGIIDGGIINAGFQG